MTTGHPEGLIGDLEPDMQEQVLERHEDTPAGKALGAKRAQARASVQ